MSEQYDSVETDETTDVAAHEGADVVEETPAVPGDADTTPADDTEDVATLDADADADCPMPTQTPSPPRTQRTQRSRTRTVRSSSSAVSCGPSPVTGSSFTPTPAWRTA